MSNSVPTCAWRTSILGSSRPGQVVDAARTETAEPARPHPPSEPSPLPLRKGFGWSFLANGVDAVCRALTIIIVAKLGNTEMVGILLFALAITNPVSIIGNLGLRTVLVTDAKHEHSFSDYFRLRLLTSLLALLAIGPATLLLDCDPSTRLIIVIAALGMFFESLSDIIHGMFQQYERMDWVAISILLREPAVLAVLTAGLCFTGNLAWGLLGFPVVAGTVWACHDLPKARRVACPSAQPTTSLLPWRLQAHWNIPAMRTLIRRATPAGMAALLLSLFFNLPRYIIEHSLGAHALGIFGAINTVTMSPTQFVLAMGTSAGPRLAKYCSTGNISAFVRLVAIQIVFLAGLGLVGILFIAFLGQLLLSVLYDSHIAAHVRLAVYLMIATAIRNCNGPFARALDAMHSFWPHLAIRAIGLITLLVLLLSFSKDSGLEGVAWAMILSALLITVLYIIAILHGLHHLTQRSPPALTPTTTGQQAIHEHKPHAAPHKEAHSPVDAQP